MSEKPRTGSLKLNGTAMTILKWLGGIAAAVIGTLIVIVSMGTAKAVVSHSNRITAVETKNEARDASLKRIETKVDKLLGFHTEKH